MSPTRLHVCVCVDSAFRFSALSWLSVGSCHCCVWVSVMVDGLIKEYFSRALSLVITYPPLFPRPRFVAQHCLC